MAASASLLTLRRSAPASARLGAASTLAGLGWIGGVSLASGETLTSWLVVGAALLVGGLSVFINGLIGREMAQRKELARDLQSAARIQRSLFPGTLPEIAGCEFAMACRMSREIGGDCVDAFELDDGRLAVLVGDVAGKGISAALVMSGVQAHFRALARQGLPLPAIAGRIEQQLLERRGGPYVTAVMLLVDAGGGVIDYLSAGHVPFVLVAPGVDPRPIDSTGPPLGLLPAIERPPHHLPLPPGTTLVLVTDGITERCRDTIHYGIERLLGAASAVRNAGVGDALDALLADNDRFARGEPADDDLTVVVMRRQPQS